MASVEPLEHSQSSLLSVEQYDTAEREAAGGLPNRVIAAFQPAVFSSMGYPTRVTDYPHAWRYADVMHETRFEGDFRGLIGGLTEHEFVSTNAFVRRLSNSLNNTSVVR